MSKQTSEVAPAVPAEAVVRRAFGAEDERDFKEPPKVFWPETWFHFLGSNVRREGITADLEAIAGAGIGGVQLFHGNMGGAPFPGVREPVPCLSAKWDELVRHVGLEARRLGLRLSLHNCPGWSCAGGPWISEENAMRNLAWSRVEVPAAGAKGGVIEARLPKPAGRDFQDIAVLAFPTPLGDSARAGGVVVPAAVKALPAGKEKPLPWASAFHGLAKKGDRPFVLLRTSPDAPLRCEVRFDAPVVLRSFEFPTPNSMSHNFYHPRFFYPEITVVVEAVIAGGRAVELVRVALPQDAWQSPRNAITIALREPPVATDTYRLTLIHPPSDHRIISMQGGDSPFYLKPGVLRFSTAARKNSWESEAAWTLRSALAGNDSDLPQNPAAWLRLDDIQDITAFFDTATGVLRSPLPAPRSPSSYTILRLGHVNAGRRNAAAPGNATGWECDKLSDAGPAAHYPAYIGRLARGPLAGGLLTGTHVDSWECHTQTWTRSLERDFRERAGYALRAWLPAVADGYVIESPEHTARFLRDWRAVLGDLFANGFYGGLARRARADGLAFEFETAAGDVVPADILEYYKHADIPMCEYHYPVTASHPNFKPIRPTASAARLYGKPRVAAEAFTSGNTTWDETPAFLKEIANINAAAGITHPVFHTYAHNPATGADFKPPGSAFGDHYGAPFLRGQTWWHAMPDFCRHLARLSLLLERGSPANDILWYLGDEIPHKPDQLAPFPEGFAFDYCNPDALLTRLSVRPADGALVTPDGTAWRVLWLPDTRRMLPETLERLAAFARAGATIVGDPPRACATLTGGTTAQHRFDNAVREIWGEEAPAAAAVPAKEGSSRVAAVHGSSGSPPALPAARRLGRGRVFRGSSPEDLAAALAALRLAPDVLTTPPPAPAPPPATPARLTPAGNTAGILFAHRRAAGADWYFVCAEYGAEFAGEITLRNSAQWPVASGQWSVDRNQCPAVEIWHPTTGAISRAAGVRRTADDRLAIPLRLARAEAVFVVIRHTATTAGASAVPSVYGRNAAAGTTTAAAALPAVLPITRITLTFPAGWGAPATPIALETLAPWKDLPAFADNPEARAFSGTATYRATFTLPAPPPRSLLPAPRSLLVLGKVRDIAVITLNGRRFPALWSPPYELDVTGALVAGENVLEIAVTGTWLNRLAYDFAQPPEQRKTWTVGPPRGRKLLPADSGLLGPVVLLAAK
ncbi:MAG: hypothetical protein LBR07_02285 [Puniceicoccales bacterium]|jgi:hypothetical protein|nr:hypothetical protein [Puniceicoccales bacterium]